MANFLRVYSSVPPLSEITRIEGVILVNEAPPGQILGVFLGVVAIVGEFADMGRSHAVDSNGNVTVAARPASEITSGPDFEDKFGSYDTTLGRFGSEFGNGWCMVRGKVFAPGGLVLAAVPLCSAKGARLWRQLPTNRSSTSATPVQPIQSAVVPAGTEFKSGSNRLRVGTKVLFTGEDAYVSGLDGVVTSAGAAAVQSFFSASMLALTGSYLRADGSTQTGVNKGDILVLGVIGASGAQGTNALTYRVATAPGAEDELEVERMDGTNFDWTTGTLLAWRLHPAGAADSAGVDQAAYRASAVKAALADVTGYLIPARPLDASIAANFLLTPTVRPPDNAATSWDPLAGLQGAAHPTGGIVYTAAVQAPNVANNASMDALYQAVIDTLKTASYPESTISIVVSARSSSTINAYLKGHVLDATSSGLPRLAIITPPLDTHSVSTVLSSVYPGVGATRDERIIYSYPGVRQSIRELVNLSIATSDSKTTTDGIIDVPSSGFYASALSLLAVNRNPGQASDPIPRSFSNIAGLCRGAPALDLTTYTLFKARGVSAFRVDTNGPIIQSGVTTSLDSRYVTIQRLRTQDFVGLSLAQALDKFCKEPKTDTLKNAVVSESQAFLDGLIQQELITDGFVDGKSADTKEFSEAGVLPLLVYVKTIPTADYILIRLKVGTTVEVVRG